MNKEALPDKKIGVIGGNIPIKTTSLLKTLNDPAFLQESLIEAIDLCAKKDAESEALLTELETEFIDNVAGFYGLLSEPMIKLSQVIQIIQSKRAKR